MENGILRSCALFGLAVFCVHATVSSIAAQQSQQTREGIITTFAPVVEKVAPSVVTVFTTQTLSRGQTAFSIGANSQERFFLGKKTSACLLRKRLRNIRGTEPQSISCDSTQGNPGRWRVEEDQQYENI